MIIVNKNIPERIWKKIVSINKMKLGTSMIIIDDFDEISVDDLGILYIPYDDHFAIRKSIEVIIKFIKDLSDGIFDIDDVFKSLKEIIYGRR